MGKPLLEVWKEEKQAKRLSKTGSPSFQPSRHLPTSRPTSSNGLKAAAAFLRSKRSRPIVEDTSSIVDSDTDVGGASHTPSLALSALSPADDWDPDSPAPEISETQGHPSAAPTSFSVRIPKRELDGAEYLLYQGSPAYTASLLSTSQEDSQHYLKSSSSRQPDPSQPSPSQQLRNNLWTTHQNLLAAIEVSSQPVQQIEVPASSEELENKDSQPAPPGISSSVVHESGSTVNTTTENQEASVRTSNDQPSSISLDSQPNNILSSAQPASQGVWYPEAQSQSLIPIEAEQPSQSSSGLVFQTQVSPPRTLASRLSAAETLSQVAEESEGQSDGMDASAVRQSPRLQGATLATGSRSPRPSPRPTPREQLRRATTPQKDEGEDAAAGRSALGQSHNYGSHLSPHARATQSRLSQQYTSAQSYQEPALAATLTQDTVYDHALGSSALPIQQSIEEEPSSSAEEHNSIASKASSSQASLQNERPVQADGMSLPETPVFGEEEYAVPLPAEGKIQSSYTDIINSKRKTILKFIHRRDSVGSANGHPSRTQERNDMIELMDRLHDAVTHFDLGLPGFATQYSIDSQHATKYAEYSGSKFVFLGHLIDIMSNVDCTIIIACKSGRVQDLLVDFLKMKHVRVHRFDRPGSARSITPDVLQATLKVDVISTFSDFDIHCSPRPILMIAFDCTLDSQSAHIQRIRELHSQGRHRPLPVLHLLVQNSSEHIDRCLRKAMPSPQRLKVLVRATWQARTNLGGSPTYVPAIGDEPEGRPMDLSDLQRGVRKSPNRKLNMIAAIVAQAALSGSIPFKERWSLGDIPEVQYDEFVESPPESSQITTAANTATATPRDGRARSRTPLSRAGTPSGRKRLLEVQGASSALSKRVRLSPARDFSPTVEVVREAEIVEQLREQLKAAAAELATEKELRLKAEEDRDNAQKRVQDYTRDHEGLMRRYEKRRAKTRELDTQIKQMQTSADFNKTKHEKTVENNTKLKEQVAQLKTELTAAREDLKKEGGDIGALEEAREEARKAKESNMKLEKSVENTKRDFEFTRQQYQEASNRAAELGGQTTELEEQVAALKIQASDEKRRLREMNTQEASKRDLAKIESLEQENKGMQVMIKKMEEKMKVLEKGRGVQTRGSSQPPGTPPVAQGSGYGTRSRQGSPAPGTVLSASRDAREAHGGGGRDRVSGLRHER